jgi:hypothetical protein
MPAGALPGRLALSIKPAGGTTTDHSRHFDTLAIRIASPSALDQN